ncbi:SixA phosphatase family protein [Hydrocarboniphaga sp.]|uniref:SixA phosphatase family protein n=1 Tax=Hydrocarboniphaga sp. TaxID=2033016 RepID=UPI003D0C9DC6
MRSLTLVRHAKSSWDNAALADFDRPLNERGRRDAPLMAQRFAHAAETPLQLVASPALRTTSTALVFAEALGVPADSIRYEPQIYEADVETLLAVVRGLSDEVPNAVLFGHNPGFTDLCHALARCDFTEMPTCAVARIDFDVEHWRDVASGRGRLMAYSYPKERQ